MNLVNSECYRVFYVWGYWVSGLAHRQVCRTEQNVPEPVCFRNCLLTFDEFNKASNKKYVPRLYWRCNFIASATVVVYCAVNSCVKGGGLRGGTPLYYVIIMTTVEIEKGKYDSSNF
jgi:hypothetical protein